MNKYRIVMATTLITIGLGAGFKTSAAFVPPQTTSSQISALPEGIGRDTTARECGQCHGLGVFSNHRLSRDEWNSVITRMLDKGMIADEDSLYEISDYLTEYLSKDAQKESTVS